MGENTSSAGFSHIDEHGRANMVDVTEKLETTRTSKAVAEVRLGKKSLDMLLEGTHKKGEVLAVARIAGIQAAKRTSDLIPLCHPLMLGSVNVEFDIKALESVIEVRSTCKLDGKTGVEMEALTAVSVAALTIYDMCKAVDKGIAIENIRLLEKTGGKSGSWRSSKS